MIVYLSIFYLRQMYIGSTTCIFWHKKRERISIPLSWVR